MFDSYRALTLGRSPKVMAGLESSRVSRILIFDTLNFKESLKNCLIPTRNQSPHPNLRLLGAGSKWYDLDCRRISEYWGFQVLPSSSDVCKAFSNNFRISSYCESIEQPWCRDVGKVGTDETAKNPRVSRVSNFWYSSLERSSEAYSRITPPYPVTLKSFAVALRGVYQRKT